MNDMRQNCGEMDCFAENPKALLTFFRKPYPSFWQPVCWDLADDK